MEKIIVSRHATQEIMRCALTTAPRPCMGLLAGHGCSIDAATPLVPHPQPRDPSWRPQAADFQDAVERILQQGMSIIGWFHSQVDSHEPDEAMMQWLEHLSKPIPVPGPEDMPVHLLIALDTKGRLDLHAYVRNHANRLESVPLTLFDDTPLYLRSVKR